MSHLPAERLAALVEEAPTLDELAHLGACPTCARERASFQALATLARAESAQIGAPLTRWEALRPALVADRVIDTGELHLRGAQLSRPWLQAAAAVLLVAGGAMAGRYSAGATMLTNVTPVPAVASVAQPVSDSQPQFASIEEARAAQERSQILYQTATAFLAQRDTVRSTTAAKRVRLAALDRANQVFGAALNEAPYDPVISGSYLTTLGQREATLRQLNTVAPASMRIQSY